MKTITSKLSAFNFVRTAFLTICLFLMADVSSQNIDAILTESWTNSSWAHDTRTLNTYDGNNYLTNSLSQTWDADLAFWTNVFQSNFTNNPDGTVSQIIGQFWAGDGWGDSTRITYTYTAFGEELTVVSEYWAGTDWLPITKKTNTYDGSEYLTHTLVQSWDIISSSWQNSSQSNYTNNANGTVNQVIDQTWNPVTSSWDNFEKTNFTYNAVLAAISQTWEGSWVNDTRITNTYNGANLTNSLSQDWDVAESIWANNSQDNYTYTGSLIYQIVSQVWESGAWVNVYRTTFTYSPLAIQRFDSQKGITAYPVPAQDYIMVRQSNIAPGSNYVVSDAMGNTFQSGFLKAEETAIDIHALSAGVYFIQIGQPKQVIKIIKD